MARAKIKGEDAAKVTSKGQCTIPKNVREELGLHPGDEIVFFKDMDGQVVVRKRIAGNPFEKWRGYAKHLAGVDVDELIREMRGR